MNDSILQNPWVRALLALLCLFLLVLVINNGVTVYQKVAPSERQKDTLTVSGTGKITSKPDIAYANLSVLIEGRDPKVVQEENTKKINEVISFLKSNGVKEDDITTQNYNLYPQYNYDNGKQTLSGYSLNQTVVVKLRDLSKVGEIMTGVVKNGANTINSLSFQIDDPDGLRQEARKKALESAKAKAQELAAVAGVKLGKVKSFSEGSVSLPEPYPYAMDRAMGAGGYGGGGVPDIQPGVTDVTASVSVTFELN